MNCSMTCIMHAERTRVLRSCCTCKWATPCKCWDIYRRHKIYLCTCLSYFWGNDGVIGAAEFLIYILCIGKHSREKTFMNFVVLWLFAEVFSVKFGGVASFGVAKVSNWQKLSPWKSYFSPIAKVFSLESFPLYIIPLSNLVVCSLDSLVPSFSIIHGSGSPSSASMYYTERKPKKQKTGEAWEWDLILVIKTYNHV